MALAARPAAGPRLEFLVRSARRRHQLVARVVFEARHSLLCEGLVVDEHLLKAAAELDQQLLPPLLERQSCAPPAGELDLYLRSFLLWAASKCPLYLHIVASKCPLYVAGFGRCGAEIKRHFPRRQT